MVGSASVCARRWAALGLALALLTACGGPAADRLAAGDPAPDFTLPAADGSVFSLAELRGRQPVLLYFHMAAG
ncbi:redoxin domain-containing protein [Kallotenue papyrolyticum]|uniref:redoxin domain-containing protein n=1 Tax=Kallotenue papyrolyticum TaxID=1325125 RepID=UPI0004B7A59F